MHSERSHSLRTHPGRFSHPLLRLAAQSGSTPETFRQFNRFLRRALNESLVVEERIQNARQVMMELPHLGLPRDVASAFLLEWLKDLTSDIHHPLLQHALALEELVATNLTLLPACWGRRTRGHDDYSVPHLQDLDTRDRRPTGAHDQAFSAWNTGFDLVQEAVQIRSYLNWNAEECCSAVRIIALSCAISPSSGAMVSASARLRRLEGVGLGLWEVIGERMEALDDHLIACPPFWDGSVQSSLLLHLRGQLRAETLMANDRSKGDVHLERTLDNTTIAAEPGWLRVVTAPIPPGSNSEDKGVLQCYATLREPQPLAQLPTLGELTKIFGQLDREYPWAATVVDEVRRTLITRSLFGVQEMALAPVLLVGPPGSGKSRFVRRVAELLQLPYMPLSIGGVHDSKVLTGTARGWSGGEPSPILKFLVSHRMASAMVLLDEIDKVNSSFSNAPPVSSVLLGMLEPETARRWRDNFLQTTCDLSHVSFWATANSLERVPRALLSRFTILYMPEPRECDRQNLVESIVEDIAREWRLPPHVLPVPPALMSTKSGRSGRELRRAVLDYLHEWALTHRSADRMH